MPGPLEGIRVLDFTRTIAGPLCTQTLGDMGADVIKVEERESGDETRSWPPFWNGQGCVLLAFNRNKRSLTLDLKHPEGRAIARKLAARADVLAESFRGGVADKLGLGYEEISRTNPGIVYLSISGYGRTGPMADEPGYDLVMQGFGGLMSVTGEPGHPPVRMGYSLVDMFCGMSAYGSVVSALFHRQRTGQGQRLEASLMEGQVSASAFHMMSYLATGNIPGPLGSRHPAVTPCQAFEASDGWFMLVVGNDGLWQRFCKGLGLDDVVDDPRFRTTRDRVANTEALVSYLARLFKTRPRDHWLRLIHDAGVPAGPINNVAQLMEEPQVKARQAVVALPHPQIPEFQTPATPFKAYGTPPTFRLPPPLHGQHTDEVLRELGYNEADIARLRRERVI